MTTPAAIWADVMAARAKRRSEAVAAGKSSPEDAARDAELCALFMYICVERREQDDQFVTLAPSERADVHAAITIAVRIADRASDPVQSEALWSIARPARASMTLLHAALDARQPA